MGVIGQEGSYAIGVICNDRIQRTEKTQQDATGRRQTDIRLPQNVPHFPRKRVRNTQRGEGNVESLRKLGIGQRCRGKGTSPKGVDRALKREIPTHPLHLVKGTTYPPPTPKQEIRRTRREEWRAKEDRGVGAVQYQIHERWRKTQGQ